MAITVTQSMTHALAVWKLPSTAFTAEEVRMANTVQDIVTNAYPWHWTEAAGTNVAVSSGTQDYSLAAGDQNKVLVITTANLTEGGTEQPPLLIAQNPQLEVTTTTGQPFAVSLISPTTIRFYPTPDATYTFKFRYCARAVVFAANTESYQCPDTFAAVIKAGMIWQIAIFIDDDRADKFGKTFEGLLEAQIAQEKRLRGRIRA